MKLLVATDGSEDSTAALAYATDIADATGAAVTVAYAVEPDVFDTGGDEPISTAADADERLIIQNVEDAERRGLAALEDAAEFAADLGTQVETELLYGNPVAAITDYAAADGFDTIYLGHRGRSERTDLMVGSVAKEVVERATMPVTVVR